jgi:hypothetical protein
MVAQEYTIQELSELSGVQRRNIYFYTQQGILPPADGAGLGARYNQVHLLRLRAIPVLRRQGLRLTKSAGGCSPPTCRRWPTCRRLNPAPGRRTACPSRCRSPPGRPTSTIPYRPA